VDVLSQFLYVVNKLIFVQIFKQTHIVRNILHSSNSCYCDDVCVDYNDCCYDHEDTCRHLHVPTTTSTTTTTTTTQPPNCSTAGAYGKLTGSGSFSCTKLEKKKGDVHICVVSCDSGKRARGPQRTRCKTFQKNKSAFEWHTAKDRMINC